MGKPTMHLNGHHSESTNRHVQKKFTKIMTTAHYEKYITGQHSQWEVYKQLLSMYMCINVYVCFCEHNL